MKAVGKWMVNVDSNDIYFFWCFFFRNKKTKQYNM